MNREATSPTWDCMIVGAGPAGLNAALVLGRARRRVLVLDNAAPRNYAAHEMHGVLGHDGLDPAELRAAAAPSWRATASRSWPSKSSTRRCSTTPSELCALVVPS
jgi:2-polyprenyl-6-methoxyphenol hydroxylase-like FAD-dependent oxidoreductase